MFDYTLHIHAFLNYCQFHKNLSSKTICAYQMDLKQFLEFTLELDKRSLWNFIEHLNRSYKPKTVKRKLATLKAFIRYLLMQDLIEYNPFDKIQFTIKEPTLLPKSIPLDIIRQLFSYLYAQIASAQSDYQIKCAVRNAAVIELLFATGARIAEVCTLRKDNLDLLGHKIKFYGKGSKERILPIENESVIHILNQYCTLFEDDIFICGFFFVNKQKHRLTEQSVRDMIHTICNRCGISMHITPHMFRHSFATFLLEEDVDIRYIQKMLGHSSIMTTQIYTHVATAKQKEILKMKHPRNKIDI